MILLSPKFQMLTIFFYERYNLFECNKLFFSSFLKENVIDLVLPKINFVILMLDLNLKNNNA